MMQYLSIFCKKINKWWFDFLIVYAKNLLQIILGLKSFVVSRLFLNSNWKHYQVVKIYFNWRFDKVSKTNCQHCLNLLFQTYCKKKHFFAPQTTWQRWHSCMVIYLHAYDFCPWNFKNHTQQSRLSAFINTVTPSLRNTEVNGFTCAFVRFAISIYGIGTRRHHVLTLHLCSCLTFLRRGLQR